jgi:hypothetical protein
MIYSERRPRPPAGARRGRRSSGDRRSAPTFREPRPLDQLGFDRVFGRQLIQGLIQGNEIFARLWGRREVRFEFMSNQAASVSNRFLPSSLIDQDAPHGFRGGGEEVAAVVPASSVGRPDQPQISLVDEGGCVQSVARRLVGHPDGRQFAQLLVHQRQQFPGSLGVAVGEVGQNAGNIVNRRAPV